MFTRILDIFVALMGLLLLALMLPWIALLIKMESRGPVYYRCYRVGKGGRLFKMYKFRTMYESDCPLGPSVSPQGDPRVTDMGRWLRRSKLNEFPQFFNLLKGDMTLIGPRPEAPDLAAGYPLEAKAIFAVKPGLIGPNQIMGRNEEEWFPSEVDPQQYYLEHILPSKVARDLDYINNKTFWGDLKLIVSGVWATMAGAISRRHVADNLTQLAMLFLDMGFCLFSLTLATLYRYDWLLTNAQGQTLNHLLPLAVICRLPIFYYFGFYQTLVRYFSLTDVKTIIDGVLFGSGLFIVGSYLSGINIAGFGRSICLIDWFLLTCLLVGYRATAKILHMRLYDEKRVAPATRRRALIWGADDEGMWCHRYLKEQREPLYEVVGFIDPDPKKLHRRVDGLKVLGDQHHLEILTKLYKIQEILITGSAYQEGTYERLQKKCNQLSLGLKQFKPMLLDEPSVRSTFQAS